MPACNVSEAFVTVFWSFLPEQWDGLTGNLFFHQFSQAY